MSEKEVLFLFLLSFYFDDQWIEMKILNFNINSIEKNKNEHNEITNVEKKPMFVPKIPFDFILCSMKI